MTGSQPLRLMYGTIQHLRESHRRPVAFTVYAIATAFAYQLAYLLRFEFSWQSEYTGTLLGSLPVLLAVRFFVFRLFCLSTARWRFAGLTDLLRLAGAAAVGSAIFLAVSRLLPLTPRVPLSVVALEGLLTTFLIASIWVTYRMLLESFRYRREFAGQPERRVLIIGAGESGYMLAREMLRQVRPLRPIGFVDDDPHKRGTRLAGLTVLGSTRDLREITARYLVEELILAVPNATPAQMRVLVERCEQTELPFRVLPSIAAVLAGDVRLDQIREVRIEDLLGREPVRLELKELAADLAGKCALVTGAAGSIGSELCRQLALHSPAALILFDQSETGLYYLELELRSRYPDMHIVTTVGDIVDRLAVESVCRMYRPTHIYHAAAYKHVPMMETNVRAAIRNNVVGTRVVASAAGRFGAKRFVLVSTDKAVRPSSVMGATKRLAEIATLEYQVRFPDTVYAAVRFGNVLGSSGSVIPVFKRQLAAGEALTVTHPEVTRYFMTIPEAVQLILQASLLPEIRGHIAMLEMGEPVRILDLAENLLRLSGIRGSERGKIVFTGLRPGEKLHEELVDPEEETAETEISKVRVIKVPVGFEMSVGRWLEECEECLSDGSDAELVARLVAMFPYLSAAPNPIAFETSGHAAAEVPLSLVRGA